MTSGISSATSGLVTAVARVDRAAAVIATQFEPETPSPALEAAASAPQQTDLVGAQIDLMMARFQFSASLVALKASTDMLAQAIEIGGYGLSADDLR